MVLRRSMGGGESLAGDLWILERDSFDVDEYIRSKCPAMSEKGVKKLRQEMIDLKNAFIDFLKRNVHAEYTNFISATRDISGLETSLFRVRNLLSNQVAIIHGLLEQSYLPSDSEEEDVRKYVYEKKKYVPSQWEDRIVKLLDTLSVLMAERKTEEAVTTIEEGEKLFTTKHSYEPNFDTLCTTLYDMRERLVEELIESTNKASVRGSELRGACVILERLGEGGRAHNLLLASHQSRLLHKIKGIKRSESSYGGAYTAALSQLVFSTISSALKDSDTVFGAKPGYGSELILWTRQVTCKFVELLNKYVLSSSAAAGGLRAAAECVHIALGHCSLLEKQGLSLCPYLSSLLKPSIEQAVSANLRRLGHTTLALAAADDWQLIEPLNDPRIGRRASYKNAEGVHVRLSNSAHAFNVMIEEFLCGIEPLTGFPLAHSVFETLSQVYERYVSFLIRALPGGNKAEKNNLKTAKTLTQQLVLFGNASALAEQILPTVGHKLSEFQLGKGTIEEEEEEWKLYLHHSSDNLRRMICEMYTQNILFEKQNIPRLTPEFYSVVEDEAWLSNPLPSPPFQDLFNKVIDIAKTGDDALRGQENLCDSFIKELINTLVSSILNNREFWDQVEEGPESFSPLGLQKFVLDMQFVVHLATEGEYTSDILYKVVADNIAQATNAFALNGGDPMSVLPEDEWFVRESREAFEKLITTHQR